MITSHKTDPLKAYLRLEKLEPDPRVAHLLPSEVAREYHAIPVAVQGQVITVALADPADTYAKAALRARLGNEVCFVQADVGSIDERINSLWSNPVAEPISITFLSKGVEEGQLVKYLANLCETVNAQFTCISMDSRKFDAQLEAVQSEKPCDLLVYARGEKNSGRRNWKMAWEKKFLRKAPVSTLLLKNTRWPIQNLLLFVQGLDLDESALAWTVALGRLLGAAVTVVPLFPILPALYATDARMAYNIPELLKSDCQLGKRLRKICAVLDASEIKGTLELQSTSSSHQQLCSQYDLMLVSGAVKTGAQKIYYHDVIQRLLQVENVNLLVSKGNPFHDHLIDWARD